MGIRTILAAASGGTASSGSVELACRLARRFEAHLEGFHVRIDPREILAATAGDGFGVGLPLAGEWMDKIDADSAELAGKTKAAFDAAVARHDLALTPAPSKGAASAAWREDTGYAPLLVSQRARFFDLLVLGRSDRVVERPHTDTVEEALLHSGRPILLAPAQPPAVVGEKIAVGWNGSTEAVKALAVSLPLLAAAKAVSVITVGDKDVSVASVIEYLAWHGIGTTHHGVRTVSGSGPGEQLLAEAREVEADLLVMGGYGHMPWREFLFGGATRQIVGTSLLPLLLSH
jgi:nucleotide-binding universal stress UspA family protein